MTVHRSHRLRPLAARRERASLARQRRQVQRDLAYGLVPEIAAPDHRRAGIVVPALCLTVCLGLVATLFRVYWVAGRRDGAAAANPFTQTTVQAPLPAAERAAFARIGRSWPAGVGGAPVILAYHDIRPDASGRRFVVTPQRFARQLEMMRLEGYHTLTADEFVRYTEGTFRPRPRSVLLTFDDGTSGLYRYADPLLARYGFSAVSFLISGHNHRTRGYYLSWPQIQRMRQTGRWSFQAHTHDLHVKGTTVGGKRGSALTSRQVHGGHPESVEALRRRVANDLDRCLADFADHGLPRPVIFAWPFSEMAQRAPDPAGAAVAMREIRRRFALNVVNTTNPLPVTAAEVRRPFLQRQEIRGAMTEQQVSDLLHRQMTMPVTRGSLLRMDPWFVTYGEPEALDRTALRSGTLRPAGGRRFRPMFWAPQRTSQWSAYRLSATLVLPGNAEAGVIVHGGSTGEVTVISSPRSVAVRTASGRILARVSYGTTTPVHRLDILVRRNSLTATAGGRTVYRGPVTAASGGPGVAFSRQEVGDRWPDIADLTVQPVAGS